MVSTKTFSPKELAPIIGVSQSSIKRWVDAGLIAVTRTAGGHRRILLSEALRFIRDRDMQILRPDLLGLPDLETLKAEVDVGELTGDVLLHVLESDDAVRARGLITVAFLSGRKPDDLFDGPVREALVVLGERWKQSHTGIFLEHRATQIIIEAVNQVHMLIPEPEPSAPLAVGGAPPDDPYMLPSMMAATVLADLGYRAVNLGAQTPIATLLDAVDAYQPRLVWVAATAGNPFVEAGAEWDRAFSALHGRGVHIVVGGQAVLRSGRADWPAGVQIMESMADLAAFAGAEHHES